MTRPPGSGDRVTDGSEPLELPERLRLRVVALVAEVLPVVTPLPVPLRKIAGFTPARRARLGGSAIWSELKGDEDFRQRAATQVAGHAPTAGESLETGARAWLLREEGWREEVQESVRALVEDETSSDGTAAGNDRLRAQLEALQQELRDQRAEQRERLQEARAENTLLRSRVGEARAALRAAQAEADAAHAERDRALDEVNALTRAAETETRRLRAQLDDATAGLAAARSGSRSERDTATVRARYLLDTVVDAAAGLRRELALPAVEGTPGDSVEAGLAPVDAPRTSTAPPGPAVLDQLLALPRARLIIDGYNVTKSVWGSATLEAQRGRLVTALAPLAARTGAETTVVFDAAASASRPVVPVPRGVKVVFSPPGVIADDVIRQLVSAEPVGRVVVVISSDQEVARDVSRAGARALESDVLVRLLAR